MRFSLPAIFGQKWAELLVTLVEDSPVVSAAADTNCAGCGRFPLLRVGSMCQAWGENYDRSEKPACRMTVRQLSLAVATARLYSLVASL